MTRLQPNRIGVPRWLAWIKSGLQALLGRRQSLAGAAKRIAPVSAERSRGVWDNSDSRESSYWETSTAPAETLWQIVTDLADIASWHPLIKSTNAPYGQRAKPGLIYRACNRYFPLSTQVFVERVLPGELLSIRLFPLPGLQERVTYRIVSTLCGSCVLYSMTLTGWLSPLAWPMMKPQSGRVAAALVEAAEQAALQPNDPRRRLYRINPKTDIF